MARKKYKRKLREYDTEVLSKDSAVVIQTPSPYATVPYVVQAKSGDIMFYDGETVVNVMSAAQFSREFEE